MKLSEKEKVVEKSDVKAADAGPGTLMAVKLRLLR
jgi:hypothetical protein